MNFLGSGNDYGVKLSYALQDGAGGIAEALGLASEFAEGSKIAVILGDNIFEDDFSADVERFHKLDGAMVFLKRVDDASRFGVAEVEGDQVVGVEEKPKNPKSNLAVTGFYLYGPDVFKKITTLKPSSRNELEITDIQNLYHREKRLSCRILQGFWSDAGTFDSLLKAGAWVAARKRNG